MSSFVMIIAGARGTGKSTFTKEVLNQITAPKYIYDINNEYQKYYKKPFVMFDTFLQQIKPVKNSLIVFEEASIFLGHHNSKNILIEKLTRARHENNSIILNFHSLRKIPVYILEFSNYLTLFKTADQLDFIQKKFNGFSNIEDTFLLVKNSNDRHFKKIIQVTPTI